MSYFKVTLNSHAQKNYVEFKFFYFSIEYTEDNLSYIKVTLNSQSQHNVSVVILPFQKVSQKWFDGLNSNLALDVTGPQGMPYFKVTLNSN